MLNNDQLQSIRKRFEPGVYNDFNRALNQQRNMLIDTISRNPGSLENLSTLVTCIKAEPLRGPLIRTYESVGVEFAEIQRQDFNKRYGTNIRKKDIFTEVVRNNITAVALGRITTIHKTSKDRALFIIQGIVQEGIAQGMGIKEIAEEMDAKLKGAYKLESNFRSARIARTEIHGASNKGQLEGANAAQLPMWKIWSADFSAETRDTHADVNEQRREMDEKFYVDDEELSYPGSHEGSAKNVINCRCGQLFEVK